MDKKQFIEDLKNSVVYHYKNIKTGSPLISLGIYTDGDASTIGIYYNTVECLERKIAEEAPSEKGYYIFFMEEWEEDISYTLCEERLDLLNRQIDAFGSAEYKAGNENYKDDVFDLFVKALEELKQEGIFNKESKEFFLHVEVSDYWIDEQMLTRIARLHSAERFKEYQLYAES